MAVKRWEELGQLQRALHTSPGDELSDGRDTDGSVTPRTALADLTIQTKYFEQSIMAIESSCASLRAKMNARQSRMQSVTKLVEERENELGKTEASALKSEAMRASLAHQREQLERRLSHTEHLIRIKQRELHHLSNLPDDNQTSITNMPAEQIAKYSMWAEEDNADDDARVLRQLAKRGQYHNRPDARYVEFHTVCMGLKLSMGDQPRLRNVQIDELWDEVQRIELPPSKWHAFARGRLLAPSESRKSRISTFMHGPARDVVDNLKKALGIDNNNKLTM